MSKPLRKVSLKKKQEIPSPFVLVVSYPKESKVILEAFKGNNTIYQVIQTCINKFGLKFDENNQFILRYAHQVLDPMVSLSESRIPKSSELILENVAHISTNPIVDVTLRDIEEGIVQAGKFDENENLWNVAEKLIPNGKYIRPDKVKICSSEISFIGKKQLEATKLNSAFRGSHVDLRLCPTYSDIDNQEAEYEKKKKLRRQRTSKKAAMTDGNYNLLNIRTKMTTINKSTKVSTLKQLSGVYYSSRTH
ncbi:hypothetical protein O3M35_011021 [Rhynocoris fuscipes]|uniref:Uncharacterized protein n=1 Tax=Rhynocoris fuscipes TaxID=488301 RepID=A0AAW1CV53_9HEMI